MNENPQDSRLVSGDGPINRRTVKREHLQDAAQQDAENPEVIARALRAHARHALGSGLAQLVRQTGRPHRQTSQGLQIASTIVLACGVVVGLLAWLQVSVLLVGSALVLLGLGAIGMLRSLKNASATRLANPGMIHVPIFDDRSLQAFDEVLEKTAPELGPTAIALLCRLKASLAEVAGHAGRSDEYFTQEDRMFLVECLRRYIPDSIEAYLRVPKERRSQALLPEGTTAEDSLCKQLTGLQEEIEMRIKKIGRSAAEELLKQQRFLDSKKTR
jgi:hypothetical protein